MAVASYDPGAPVVSVSPAALKHFESKLVAAGNSKLLRLSTEPSGCSGLSYVLDLVEAPQDDDELVKASEAVTLAIDKNAVQFLRGTEIDLVEEGVNRVVKFRNPNVVAECGCGESFTVA